MIGYALVLALGVIAAQANDAGPAAMPAAPNLQRTVPLGSLDIPDEIATAVVPYLQCLLANRGVEMPASDGRRRPPVAAEGSDCTSHRQEASERAERMLRNQGRGTAAERTTYVGAVLARVDRFVGNLPTALSGGPAKPVDTQVGSDRASSVPLANASARLIPFGGVEVPNPVAPALARYNECYTAEMTRRGGLPIIRPSTYRAAVEASIGACATRRAEAIIEADSALAGAPDYQDAERRRLAIARAFDGTDDQHRNLLEIMEVTRREQNNASN
jgi:hypothetical protein